jgi:hypothetical protein
MAITLAFYILSGKTPVQGIVKERYPKFRQAFMQSFHNDAVDPIWTGAFSLV